jgi:hypothetical protein
MTAKQKAARANFKKAVTEAQKLRKSNPKLTQAQALKQAFAKNKKVGAVKKKDAPKKAALKKDAPKKKAALKKVASKRITDIHKDSKSHNVNIRVVSGFVGRLVVKTFTLSELKKMNPIYFEKGKDKSAGVYKRKLIISKKLESQVMVEAQKDPFTNLRSYVIRLINAEGSIGIGKRFDTIYGAAEYIGKNIIL